MDSFLCVVACAQPKKLRWFVTRNPDYVVSTDHVDRKTERLVFVQAYPNSSTAYQALDFFAGLKAADQWRVLRNANPGLKAVQAPKPLVIAGGGEESTLKTRLSAHLQRLAAWVAETGQSRRWKSDADIDLFMLGSIIDEDEPGTGGVHAKLPKGPKPRQGSDAKAIPTRL